MGIESNRDTMTEAPPRRRRFSDRLEFRRGQVDARAGRPPASIKSHYLAGYADARREARRAGRTAPTKHGG